MTTLFQIFAFWNMNPNGHRRGFPTKKIIILVVTVTGLLGRIAIWRDNLISIYRSLWTFPSGCEKTSRNEFLWWKRPNRSSMVRLSLEFFEQFHHFAWCTKHPTPCNSKIAWSSESKWKKGDCYWVGGLELRSKIYKLQTLYPKSYERRSVSKPTKNH